MGDGRLASLHARSEGSLRSPIFTLTESQEDVRQRVLRKYRDGTYSVIETDCLCGTQDASDMLISPRDRYGLPSPSVMCQACGIVRTTPRLDEASLDRFYEEDYRPLYSGAAAAPDVFFTSQVDRGKRVMSFLGSMLAPGSRIADIGCGAGGLLVPFRNAGHTVYGCDLGSSYLERGRREGLHLEHGDASTLADRAPFDLVLLSHVVEHIPDPVGMLRDDVAPLLEPGGMVYVELPGLRDIGRYVDPLRYFQNAHLWSFDLGSLSWVLGHAGFELVHGDEWIRAVYRLTGKTTGSLHGQAPAANLEAILSADRNRASVVGASSLMVRRVAHRVAPQWVRRIWRLLRRMSTPGSGRRS